MDDDQGSRSSRLRRAGNHQWTHTIVTTFAGVIATLAVGGGAVYLVQGQSQPVEIKSSSLPATTTSTASTSTTVLPIGPPKAEIDSCSRAPAWDGGGWVVWLTPVETTYPTDFWDVTTDRRIQAEKFLGPSRKDGAYTKELETIEPQNGRVKVFISFGDGLKSPKCDDLVFEPPNAEGPVSLGGPP